MKEIWIVRYKDSTNYQGSPVIKMQGFDDYKNAKKFIAGNPSAEMKYFKLMLHENRVDK